MRELKVGRFIDFCHHMCQAADPEGYAAAEVRGVEARSLTIKTGASTIDAWATRWSRWLPVRWSAGCFRSAAASGHTCRSRPHSRR